MYDRYAEYAYAGNITVYVALGDAATAYLCDRSAEYAYAEYAYVGYVVVYVALYHAATQLCVISMHTQNMHMLNM